MLQIIVAFIIFILTTIGFSLDIFLFLILVVHIYYLWYVEEREPLTKNIGIVILTLLAARIKSSLDEKMARLKKVRRQIKKKLSRDDILYYVKYGDVFLHTFYVLLIVYVCYNVTNPYDSAIELIFVLYLLNRKRILFLLPILFLILCSLEWWVLAMIPFTQEYSLFATIKVMAIPIITSIIIYQIIKRQDITIRIVGWLITTIYIVSAIFISVGISQVLSVYKDFSIIDEVSHKDNCARYDALKKDYVDTVEKKFGGEMRGGDDYAEWFGKFWVVGMDYVISPNNIISDECEMNEMDSIGEKIDKVDKKIGKIKKSLGVNQSAFFKRIVLYLSILFLSVVWFKSIPSIKD